MKDYYKISEISRLYGIGNDSLRYYEKIGILNPKRDLNGYRMYGFADITALNVIKELKDLGFGMKKIKEYLDNRNINSTIDMLLEETLAIDFKIKELEKMRNNILKRKNTITSELKNEKFGEVNSILIQERNCITLNNNIMREEEVDFNIRKLQEKYNSNLYILGNNSIGSTVFIDLKILNQSEPSNLKFSMYSSVFFQVGSDQEYDFVIPSGKYLSVKYRGNYNQTHYYIMEIAKYAKLMNYNLISEPLEIYHIDIHETSIIEEFITEIQVRYK